MGRQIITNATIILADETIEGSLVLDGGRIVEVLPGRFFSEGRDLQKRFLAPGIIDIHTDYLERELLPRPNTHFPIELAFTLMDQRAVSCGLTTILGAVRVSGDKSGDLGTWTGDGIALAEKYLILRDDAMARYFVHVRWDPNFEPCENELARIVELGPVIGNLVFNESIPGERQFKNTFDDQVNRQAALKGITPEAMRMLYEEKAEKARKINNRPKVKSALGNKIPMGSHDDTTEAHVIEAFEYGCSLAEMPVTLEAAQMAKNLGMKVCMGAPNYYRGGSHCGNLSCQEAIDYQLVDMLCSDYHFPSLLGSVVKMMQKGSMPHEAFKLISLNPAEHLRISKDLGSIEVGKLADLVSFSSGRGFGIVTEAWVEGDLKFDVTGHWSIALSTPERAATL